MFETLRIFTKVYEQRNFTRASELLFISQPTISTKIKQLEQQLNTPLFIRKGPKNIVPTEAAHTFYEYALQAIDAWHDTIEKLQEHPKRMRCLIGCSNTIGVHYLPLIMPALIEKFSHIDFSIYMENSEQIVDLLMKHTIDVGLIEKPIDTQPLQKVTICTDELVFAGNINSPIWLMREKNSGIHFFNELYIVEQNLNTQFIEVNNNEIIINFLKNGIGKTILSKKSLPNSIPYVELSNRYHRPLYALYRLEDDSPFKDIFEYIIFTFENILLQCSRT
ncbi:LysR family transcriptional regulator [Bacillus thuringiensis]|uniref:LysR family transcriptional regulator n=1 Tax=Bacillus thuringiensis TaxID=1428 RepID=UPI0026E422BE|nr:LysR family transcriptional regulator [Bacillus thuringiensis]MDO6632235.1 LysR family transcriptional regulator [Bacillus thuringiensis]MDO6661738.1 LysR family transcriptional regulator [Bacillus thuringiensis]MDO6702484.1 LysR family transcriptional regulator [Bacillus thuringiensis]